MSIQTILNFDSSANWAFDSDKVEFVGSYAQLKRQVAASSYTQPFTSDSGFTYDSALAEFTGGKVQQIDQIPTNATFGVNYDSSVNGNWGDGVLTGTAVGGAAVAGGKLNLSFDDNRYVQYAALNNSAHQLVGCFKFKVTPNYNGIPAGSQVFVHESETASTNNEMTIFHQVISGNLVFTQRNAAGSVEISFGASWTPTLGVEYEVEVNYDLTAGNCRILLNGVVHSSDLVTTGSRGSTIDLLRLGTNRNGLQTANFDIDDLMIFDTVQHTANYTPGYTVYDYKYMASKVELPVMTYPGAGELENFTNFVTTDTNTPKYVLNDLYYSSGWTASNGTFSQANTEAEVLSNIGTLPVSDTMYVDILFNNGTSQMSADNLELSYSGTTDYYTDDPTLVSLTGIYSDSFLTYTDSISEPTGTNVGYAIKKAGINYYWNGSAWVVSDLSYVQSNDAATVQTNLDALKGSEVAITIYPIAILNSDGSDTPTITSITLTYTFQSPEGPDITECNVYFYVKDLLGIDVTSAILNVSSKKSFWHSEKLIVPFTKSQSATADGYIEMSIVETETVLKDLIFTLDYTDPNTNSSSRVKFKNAQVPNQASVSGVDILEVK